jgi:hypothetical protein
MGLILSYGKLWARNDKNISEIPKSPQGGQGVYVLYDGSMPVYIGKGNLNERIRGAHKSGRRGQFWDHFSWYVVSDPDHMHDLEALLLRLLPWYLRGLNRQGGHFKDAHRASQKDDKPRPIARGGHGPKP